MAKKTSSSSSSVFVVPSLDRKRLFGLDIPITLPALVALVGYLILFTVVLLPFDMYSYDQKRDMYVKNPYNFGERLIVVVLLCLPFFLGVYSVNCMMKGQCHVWSWIVAIATVLWACIVIMTAIVYKGFVLEDVIGGSGL